jgi:hypothetical protein
VFSFHIWTIKGYEDHAVNSPTKQTRIQNRQLG